MTKQPKKSVSEVVDHRAVERVLNQRRASLWIGGSLELPVLALTARLKVALTSVRANGQLLGGLEAIETNLQREQAGLANRATNSTSGEVLERVTRLLLVSEDGSERFYRAVESLAKRIGDRLLVCKLEVPANVLGQFFGADANVKAILVTRKEFVGRVLTALLE